MGLHAPLDCPEPAISLAMLKMLNALDGYGKGCNASTLSYRSAQLIGTVRRCLATSRQRHHHADLMLASAVADFERRWSSAATIGGRFDLFERDSRRIVGMIAQRLQDAS